MGQFQAGQWFIIITIYFVLFIGVVTAVANFSAENNLNFDDGTTATGSINGLSAQTEYFCDADRYAWTPSGESYKISASNSDCSLTAGILKADVCNAINGCSWQNVTTGFWFFSSTTETCTGTLNDTYFGKNSSNNYCNAPASYNNLTQCIYLGCSWYETNPLQNEINSPKEFIGLIADIFTFRYDFGFDGLLNTLITIFLVFIPLFIWLIALYYMTPFIH